MKKMVTLAIVLLSMMMASCHKGESTIVEKSTTSKELTTLSTIQLANELAKYGYRNESASALIESANILLSTPQFKVTLDEVEEKTGNGATETNLQKNSFKPEDLLQKAKDLAYGDATILDMIAKVEGKMASIARSPIVGSVYDKDIVNAYSTVTYTVRCLADEWTEVMVSGDGDTDLDLYVYDYNGYLIDSDTDSGDDCYCSFCPKWTGTFVIKIENLGDVYNRYQLWIE